MGKKIKNALIAMSLLLLITGNAMAVDFSFDVDPYVTYTFFTLTVPTDSVLTATATLPPGADGGMHLAIIAYDDPNPNSTGSTVWKKSYWDYESGIISDPFPVLAGTYILRVNHWIKSDSLGVDKKAVVQITMNGVTSSSTNDPDNGNAALDIPLIYGMEYVDSMGFVGTLLYNSYYYALTDTMDNYIFTPTEDGEISVILLINNFNAGYPYQYGYLDLWIFEANNPYVYGSKRLIDPVIEANGTYYSDPFPVKAGTKYLIQMQTIHSAWASYSLDTNFTSTSQPTTQTWYSDFDGDGYGDSSAQPFASVTKPSGYVADNTDCDDTDATIYPGATEIAGDTIDQDCDGSDLAVSQVWYQDNDGDGFGDPNNSKTSATQTAGGVSDNTDCDDTDATVYPGATEIAGDGIDQDCNGSDLSGSTSNGTPGTACSVTQWQVTLGTGQTGQNTDGTYLMGATYRGNHKMNSVETFDLLNKKTYIKWKANSKNVFGSFWVGAAEQSAGFFTTDHSWKNSTVIESEKWYYTSLEFKSDNTYTASTCTVAYCDNGGTSFYSTSAAMSQDSITSVSNASIYAGFNDVYATDPLITIGEAKSSCNGSGGTPVGNSITIKSDLSFKLPDALYKSLTGDLNLWLDFKFFGDQSGKLLWELQDYGTAISTGNSITIASDLSFSIPNAIYQSITGDINLETNFKYFGDQGGKLLWELENYTVK